MKINDVQIISAHSRMTWFTPGFAQDSVENYMIDCQRFRYDKDLARIESAMRRGAFPATSHVTFCTVNGDRKLIDGFGRFTVSARGGYRWRGWQDEIEVETEEERQCLWEHIDNGGTIRRLRDFRRKITESSGVELTSALMNTLEGAVAYIHSGFSCAQMNRSKPSTICIDERVSLVEQYADHAATYWKATMGGSANIGRTLRTGLFLAFGMVLVEADSERAVEFFRSVVANDGLSVGDPRHLFHSTLLSYRTYKGKRSEFAARLAQCWNSHYQGETREKFNGLGRPIDLMGTPFTIGS